MASHASAKTDEEPALISRTLQPSSDTPDDSDEQIPQLYHTRSASASASASPATHPSSAAGDGENNLALASQASPQSPGTTEEQGQLLPSQSAPNCTTTQI